MNAKAKDDDASLKRLGGGRWETRDGRFTIEPQSGTWALVDNEQTDDLGLALVRGPYRSLTEAKEAIAEARAGGEVASPLEERLAEARKRPPADDADDSAARQSTGRKAGKARSDRAVDRDEKPAEPAEPRWLSSLSASDAKRARELIEKLERAGIDDAEARVRADVVGGVPTVASTAITLRIRELLDEAGEEGEAVERLVAEVAELVAGDRNRDLGVEWRIVDGDGRPVELTARQIRNAGRR
jgi:hypothetical protein